jgi:hypothetical protein
MVDWWGWPPKIEMKAVRVQSEKLFTHKRSLTRAEHFVGSSRSIQRLSVMRKMDPSAAGKSASVIGRRWWFTSLVSSYTGNQDFGKRLRGSGNIKISSFAANMLPNAAKKARILVRYCA